MFMSRDSVIEMLTKEELMQLHMHELLKEKYTCIKSIAHPVLDEEKKQGCMEWTYVEITFMVYNGGYEVTYRLLPKDFEFNPCFDY